jgi:hypothetical protein
VLIVGADGGILHVDEHGVAGTEPNPLRSAPWIRLGLLAPMLAPAMLAGACRLRVTGTTVVASRECIGAVAMMRPEATDLVQNLLGFGVRRAELAVDRFTGVVLRIQTTDDDEHPLHRLEAHSVRFDVPSTATRSPRTGFPLVAGEVPDEGRPETADPRREERSADQVPPLDPGCIEAVPVG